MLVLKEYIELERVNEAWYTTFDQETIAQAEHYYLGVNPYTQRTFIRLMDDKHESLGEVEYESAEMAIAFLEEYFDLDADDMEWNDSYEWAELEDESMFGEMLDSVESAIQKKASEQNIRIRDIDDDAEMDGQYGIAVYFHSANNRNDLDAFIKGMSDELLSTYGAQSYDFNGSIWNIVL